MKRIIFFIIVANLSVSAFAEINPKKAALLSSLIPGAGEIYTKNYKKAGFFLGSELLYVFTYFKLNESIIQKEENYKIIAEQYAGISGTHEDNFYQTIQQYDSIETYNEEIIQAARNYYLIYLHDELLYDKYLAENLLDSESNYWHWEDETNWARYINTRFDHNQFEIWSKMTLGFMLVNRLISVVDATISARRIDIAEKIEKSSFYIKPNFKSNSMMLGYKYEF